MNTTDPFTEAARAEAEQKWPYSANPDPTPAEDEDAALNAGFMAGAEWARTYLAAQEPTDYQIDVAMDAYTEASGQSVSRTWMEAAIHAYESAARRDEEKR